MNTVWAHASWSADLIQEQCLEPVGAPENSSETSLPPWRQRAHARGGSVCSYVIQKQKAETLPRTIHKYIPEKVYV